ncbi:multicopper oxidase domain-containing protein [Falsiroseomonas sp. CW058]|uniref:multicopper oxidase domain-containing protein n=1 Tax=Falsiroseomonas sp. CW058 TaxID=3388664 RepID=UPI003D3119F1
MTLRNPFTKARVLAGLVAALGAASAGSAPAQSPPAPPSCAQTVVADVVALEQAVQFNRLGAHHPAYMIYALRDDVVSTDGRAALRAGLVRLRDDRRPRPLVLRVNAGDCLTINFTNLLGAAADDDQPATRRAGVHVQGLHYVDGPTDGGAFVGNNPSGLVAPGASITYRLFAPQEGTFLFHSTAAMTGGEGNTGTTAYGLFGAVNVQPAQSEWYRSQVTRAELDLATRRNPDGSPALLATGHPSIDYDAVFPAGHPRAGRPILAMRQGNRIVHGDITAIVTGPGRGNLAVDYVPNPALEPNATLEQAPGAGPRRREEPFREFTAVFHDEIAAVQAFPHYDDPVLGHTLAGVGDKFAINYGVAGIGSQVLASRLGIGPAAHCAECKYEEFFLSSWVGADPALPVDVPANTALRADGSVDRNAPRATRALYPGDPSNVFPSYLGDRVRIRNLHAGAEQHVFHLHAHQWLSNPDNAGSAYLDSQFVGPGTGRTYEITFNGAGNRNQTVGDAIFHCHLYPHFAQGMWALWRVLDTFEWGTPLDAQGRPLPNSRAYPDGEVAQGTPIPAVVPVPTLALAPLPAPVRIEAGQVVLAGNGTAAEDNPGYPFFIPAHAGHRPPRPPLDTVDDGGLPRHVVTGGESVAQLDRLDFGKEMEELEVRWLAEAGEPVERAAMAFHARRGHASVTAEGRTRTFVTNGQPPVPGAPFADPCGTDDGRPYGGRTIRYRSAAFQTRMVLNRAGWHFPQGRMTALWEDVLPTIEGRRPPEPLVARVNSGDCVVYQHTNLVPNIYELDDYQVRTPTDIIGQHIHLVKFDVLASDGGGNGFNYEDGTLSPGEVRERINAIRRFNGCGGGDEGRDCPRARPHPFFGSGPDGSWLGAMTTVQRWFADPVTDEQGRDRTLRTVFTHDHFGPSTHQQHGLYSAVVIEPTGSRWFHPETGQAFDYSRADGGPTGWQAIIHTADPAGSYREFVLQVADFVGAYAAGGGIDSNGRPIPDPARVINGPARQVAGLPYLIRPGVVCPGGARPPCPEAIMARDPGTFAVNFRQEPLALRLFDPNRPRADGTGPGAQAAGIAGDPAYALRSDITRAMPEMNRQPTVYPPLTAGVRPGDPFTPLLRAYKGDRIEVRLVSGAHEEPHFMMIQGHRWLLRPDEPNSGWRSGQHLAISEHFEMDATLLPPDGDVSPTSDHLYSLSASAEGFWNGAWGILRTHEFTQADLRPLPNNPPPPARRITLPDGRAVQASFSARFTNLNEFNGACPVGAPIRRYAVAAVAASQALGPQGLVYNDRPGAFAGQRGPIQDPTAAMYVLTSDLVNGRLAPGRRPEPLVLRATAGECIEVTLENRLPANWAASVVAPANHGFSSLPLLVDRFNMNQLRPSQEVGLHAQLVTADVTRSDGTNVGLNATIRNGQRSNSQTVAPGARITYRWYAGRLVRNGDRVEAVPVEFGAANLMPADRLRQSGKGLVGALVVLPRGATWAEDPGTRTAATVSFTDPEGNARTFRDFVVMFQDDLNLQAAGRAICPSGAADAAPDVEGPPVSIAAGPCMGAEDPQDSGNHAFNYRTEPLWHRLGYAPGEVAGITRTRDFHRALSNALVGGDPRTPVFTARAGEELRFRILQAGGHGRSGVFALQGHQWSMLPHRSVDSASDTIEGAPWRSGWNRSPPLGATEGIGPGMHATLVVPQAGGARGVAGDYLFRNTMPGAFESGAWGLLRVTR